MFSREFQSVLSAWLLISSAALFLRLDREAGELTTAKRILWVVSAAGLTAAATWIIAIDLLPWPLPPGSRKDFIPAMLRGGSGEYPLIFWGLVATSYAASIYAVFRCAADDKGPEVNPIDLDRADPP
jgi:hypothetical protein